jgi:CDP-diacylglycerol---glycerol-3-phosphate 3-phosphatidyltransferase
MFDKRLRAGVERSLRPIGTGLKRAGIRADQLTAAGLVISAASAVAIGTGRLVLGVALLGLSAAPDLLDGAVAKASGTASPRGAFFDSVVDRVSDMLVLGGVAWYLASVDGGHAAILPLAVLGASNLVSYERARAESLGFTARGGLMERAERMIAIGAGLVFSAVLVPILWIMLALTLFTAGHRFVMVWRQADAPRRVNRPPSAWVTGRWRGWTPSVSFKPVAGRRERQPGSGTRRRRPVDPRPGDGRTARPRATDPSAADSGASGRRARSRP